MGGDYAYGCSMELCRYADNGGSDPADVERLWRQVFEAVLMSERFTRRAIDCMWEGLAMGNWERLHLTEDEESKTAGEWLDDLSADVFYTSDRASLDRLTRCHWMFRQYMRKATGDWKY